MNKNVLSIKPLLDAAKVEALADNVLAKTLSSKRNAELESWKLIHSLMEIYYQEPLALDCQGPISAQQLEQKVAEIKARFPKDEAIAKSANAVLSDLQVMRHQAEDILSLPGVEADLPRVVAWAITAGFRYGVLMRRAGAIRGQGKREHPAWPFIRAQWILKPKTSERPDRKQVIFDGVAAYQASIGAKIAWDYPLFLKPFNRQVVAKCRV